LTWTSASPWVREEAWASKSTGIVESTLRSSLHSEIEQSSSQEVAQRTAKLADNVQAASLAQDSVKMTETRLTVVDRLELCVSPELEVNLGQEIPQFHSDVPAVGSHSGTEAADQSTPRVPGEEGHALRACMPCMHFHKPKGCNSGLECEYCHLCPEGEITRRQKERYRTDKVPRRRPNRQEKRLAARSTIRPGAPEHHEPRRTVQTCAESSADCSGKSVGNHSGTEAADNGVPCWRFHTGGCTKLHCPFSH